MTDPPELRRKLGTGDKISLKKVSGGAIRKKFSGCWENRRKGWKGINLMITAFTHQKGRVFFLGGGEVPRKIELACWKAVPREQFGSSKERFGNDESQLGMEGVPCHWKDTTRGHREHGVVYEFPSTAVINDHESCGLKQLSYNYGGRNSKMGLTLLK